MVGLARPAPGAPRLLVLGTYRPSEVMRGGIRSAGRFGVGGARVGAGAGPGTAHRGGGAGVCARRLGASPVRRRGGTDPPAYGRQCTVHGALCSPICCNRSTDPGGEQGSCAAALQPWRSRCPQPAVAARRAGGGVSARRPGVPRRGECWRGSVYRTEWRKGCSAPWRTSKPSVTT